ncbi:hypothetical protein GLYMA_14G168201v4 [Glycine max]|nr:hypothetical protein GLYMA_14G168201v4 [Glycine max]KAH1094950.1 hypothetical protein GYH30_040303 [Glycine max]
MSIVIFTCKLWNLVFEFQLCSSIIYKIGGIDCVRTGNASTIFFNARTKANLSNP